VNSSYFLASRSFKNIANISISVHKINDIDISNLNKIFYEIVRLIGKSEEEDRNLVSQLWVCKTIINSTLINYSDPELMLIERSNNISDILKRSTFNSELINKFQDSIQIICRKDINSKFENVLSVAKKSADLSQKFGIIGRNLFGYDPACFNYFISNVGNYGLKFDNIINRSQLENFDYKKIFIVGASNKSSIELIRSAFYSGVTSELEVFLYDHEDFYIPSRFELPIHTDLIKSFKKINFKKINFENVDSFKEENNLNNWIEESFWSDIHSGEREKSSYTVPSYYILFENGDGAFMPIKGKILHLDKKREKENSYSLDYQLLYADILDLEEGDYVLLRTNSSGFLLNEEISMNDSESDIDEDSLDIITDWKKSLDALLLTKDHTQIAQKINDMGVNVNSAKIKQWNGVDVIAPNSEEEFRALIKVLFAEGKLNSVTNNVDLYSSNKWQEIVNYRISRQKAGTQARSNILDNLLLKIKGIDLDSSNSYENLNLNLGQNLLIRKIAMFDRTIAYVQNSELFKINEMRSYKWLR